MKDRRALYDELKNQRKNMRFDRLCYIAERFGFCFRGGKGSHRIYVRESIPDMLNFQNVRGKAKPYQVGQLIKVIESNHLLEEDANV